jgi:hypothetical protein
MKKTKNLPTDGAVVSAQILELARLPLGPSPAQAIIDMAQSLAREHGAMLAPTVGLPAIFAELQRQAKDARFDFLKVKIPLADIAKSVGVGPGPGLESVMRLVRPNVYAHLAASALRDVLLKSEAIN